MKPAAKKKKSPRSSGDWIPRFIAALSNSANIRAACAAAGINRTTAYDRREADPAFRKQWDTAMEDACDILEAEAWQRARTTSDTMLIFLLKAHRPEKYRETYTHQMTGKGGEPLRLGIELVREIQKAKKAA